MLSADRTLTSRNLSVRPFASATTDACRLIFILPMHSTAATRTPGLRSDTQLITARKALEVFSSERDSTALIRNEACELFNKQRSRASELSIFLLPMSLPLSYPVLPFEPALHRKVATHASNIFAVPCNQAIRCHRHLEGCRHHLGQQEPHCFHHHSCYLFSACFFLFWPSPLFDIFFFPDLALGFCASNRRRSYSCSKYFSFAFRA